MGKHESKLQNMKRGPDVFRNNQRGRRYCNQDARTSGMLGHANISSKIAVLPNRYLLGMSNRSALLTHNFEELFLPNRFWLHLSKSPRCPKIP